MIERIVTTPTPTVGIVIGTFGSIPYIHLQLEAWQRHYSDVPLLVHDDASPYSNELRVLCEFYGASFSANKERYGHGPGDLSALVAGLEWAEESKLDLLVKLSRRFVPRINWVPQLQTLAYVSQYPTYSSYCKSFGFGFRTECFAAHVQSWADCDAAEVIRKRTEEIKGEYLFVEPVLHYVARQVHKYNCLQNKLYETVHPTRQGSEAFGMWGFMGTDRYERQQHFLWHDAYKPFEYYLEAFSYGLRNYNAAEFEDVPIMRGKMPRNTTGTHAKKRHKEIP